MGSLRFLDGMARRSIDTCLTADRSCFRVIKGIDRNRMPRADLEKIADGYSAGKPYYQADIERFFVFLKDRQPLTISSWLKDACSLRSSENPRATIADQTLLTLEGCGPEGIHPDILVEPATVERKALLAISFEENLHPTRHGMLNSRVTIPSVMLVTGTTPTADLTAPAR